MTGSQPLRRENSVSKSMDMFACLANLRSCCSWSIGLNREFLIPTLGGYIGWKWGKQYYLYFRQEVRLREVKPFTPKSQTLLMVAELRLVELQGPSFQ